jgi:hypothetical protein
MVASRRCSQNITAMIQGPKTISATSAGAQASSVLSPANAAVTHKRNRNGNPSTMSIQMKHHRKPEAQSIPPLDYDTLGVIAAMVLEDSPPDFVAMLTLVRLLSHHMTFIADLKWDQNRTIYQLLLPLPYINSIIWMRTYEHCHDVLNFLAQKEHEFLIPLLKGLVFQPHFWGRNFKMVERQIQLERRIVDLLIHVGPKTRALRFFVWEGWRKPYNDSIWSILRERYASLLTFC